MTRQGGAKAAVLWAGGLFLGDAIIDATASRDGDHQMGQWLIADVSLLDIHLQLCMLLVTGIMLLWIIYVWATQ